MNNKDSYHFYHYGNFKKCISSVPGTKDKYWIIIIIISSSTIIIISQPLSGISPSSHIASETLLKLSFIRGAQVCSLTSPWSLLKG